MPLVNLFHPQRNWKFYGRNVIALAYPHCFILKGIESRTRCRYSRTRTLQVSSSKELKVQKSFIIRAKTVYWFHPQRNWKLFSFTKKSSPIWFHPQRNWKLLTLAFGLATLLFHPQRNWKFFPNLFLWFISLTFHPQRNWKSNWWSP